MRRFIGLALVGAIALAACGSSGGSSSSGDGQDYVDAIMKNYDSSSAKDVFTRSEANCIAKGIVDAVGVDKLKTVGTPDQVASSSNPFQKVGKDLTKAQADEVVNVLTDGRCYDFTQLIVKQATKDSSGTFSKLSKKQVDCFFGQLLSKPAFKQAMADEILGRGSNSDAVSSALSNQSDTFKILSDCNISPSQLGG